MSQAAVAIQVTERAILREVPPIEGLRRNCSRADTCTFPRDASRPVWSCEEFEGSEVTPTRATAPTLSVVMENADEAVELKGLCRQCAHRSTCRYPKPLGGVWHCEELG